MNKPADGVQNAILEIALDCIVSMDHDGTVTEFNPAAERTFGYLREDAVGKKLADLIIPPTLREAHRAGLERYLQYGRGRLINKRVEITAMRADGSEFPVEVSICQIPMSNPPAFTGFIRDLTEAKQAQEALKLAEGRNRFYEQEATAKMRAVAERGDIVEKRVDDVERQLLQEQVARAAAEEAVRFRDDFVSIAGHELKTPLSSLLMQIQILQRQLAAGQTTNLGAFSDRVEKIARAAFRLGKLVDQLLDVSRIGAGPLKLEPELIDLAEVAREVVARFADANGNPSISVRGEQALRGRWDRMRMEEVFDILISNALKYGQGQPVEVELAMSKGVAEFRVTDRGIGIDPERHKAIFQRFERVFATRDYGGLGLGLWIARQIVEASGGTVAVDSKLGHGSTFTVRLPIESRT